MREKQGPHDSRISQLRAKIVAKRVASQIKGQRDIWQKRASIAATAVAVHPRDETYIAALLGGILKISRDGGATWIETGEQ